jgi:homoserine kinase
LTDDELLCIAAELEGHPDNVAPAIMGGLVVATMDEKKVIARNLPFVSLYITVVLPDFHFPTKEARNSLPKQVDIKDAVHNLSRVLLVTDAFRTGDLRLLGEAMADRLHQPYRLKLIPGATSAMEAAKKAGAAVALSGAGPSLIAFSETESSTGLVMSQAFRSAGLGTRVFELKISSAGASVMVEKES